MVVSLSKVYIMLTNFSIMICSYNDRKYPKIQLKMNMKGQHNLFVNEN